MSADQHPDHDTISEFRKRHLKALAALFVQVLQLCREAGLVALGHVALDGTKVRANASKHKAMSYERMEAKEKELEAEVKRLLELAEKTDAEEDALYGKGKRGDELPEELKFRKTRLAKIREAKKALEERARAAGRSNFELAARSTFTARRLTAIVPAWEIAGVANVTESVIGGRAVECKPGGLWKGKNNVYGIETRLIGIEEPDTIRKALTPDLFKAKGQPFPSAGADLSAMKIPPCPWGRTNRTGEKPSRAIDIEVVTAKEHLGHNITAGGVHTVWCDGCKARLVDSGDPFVIYWINNQIKNTPFRFSEGRKYTVWFTGELGSGVMGYQGKCIDIGAFCKTCELCQLTVR